MPKTPPADPDEGRKMDERPKSEAKNRSRSPSAKRSDDVDHDEGERSRKRSKRRKSKFRASKQDVEAPPSSPSAQKVRSQRKSLTDEELSSLPKEINIEYFEQLGDNLQRAEELLDEHTRGMVWQTAEVIACIPEYIPPRRYTTKLCRCNTCCERCCVDPEHRLTGFHSNFKDAATDAPDEEVLTLSGSSDTSGLSVFGDISDVGEDGKPRVNARLAAAAREAKRAMRLARQFRSAARTMDSLECSNDSEQKMRRLYTKELMDKAVFYATKANEALAAYGTVRRTLGRVADVSGMDDVTRASMKRDRSRRSPYMSTESRYFDGDSLSPRAMFGPDSRQRYSSGYNSDVFARQHPRQPGPRSQGYHPDGGVSAFGHSSAVQSALSLSRRADIALIKAHQASDEAQMLQRVSDEALAEAKAIEGIDDSSVSLAARSARAAYRGPGAISEPDQRSLLRRIPDSRTSGRVGFDKSRVESADSRGQLQHLGIMKARTTDGDARQPGSLGGETPSKVSGQLPRAWGAEKGKSDLEPDLATQSGLKAPRPSIAPVPKHRTMRRASVSAAMASQMLQRSTKAAPRRASVSSLQGRRTSVSSLQLELSDVTSPRKVAERRASVSSLQQEASDLASPRKGPARRTSVSSLQQEPTDLASPRKTRRASVASIQLELSDAAQPPPSRKTKSLAARRASVGAGLLLKLGAQTKESSDSSFVSPEKEKLKPLASQDTFKSRAARRASVASTGHPADPLAEGIDSFKTKAARRASVSLKGIPTFRETNDTDLDTFKARAQRRASVSSKHPPPSAETAPEEQETFKARATRRASISGKKAPFSIPDDDFRIKAARRASVSSKVISPAVDSLQTGQDIFKAKATRRASVSAKAYAPDVPSDEQDSFKARATRRASVSVKGLTRPRTERGSQGEMRRASVSSLRRGSLAEGSTSDTRKAKAPKALTVESDASETFNKPAKKIPRRASVCAAKYKHLYGDVSAEERRKEDNGSRRASESSNEPFKNLKIRRSSLSASKLSDHLHEAGFNKQDSANTTTPDQDSRRLSVPKDKDIMPKDKLDKEAPTVTMSKDMLFSHLRDSLEANATQIGAMDKEARRGQIVVKIKPLPVLMCSKKVGTHCDPKDSRLLCDECDFDTCPSGSRDPKELQKIIDEGVGTPKYTKDKKGATPERKRPQIIYELSDQSLDIEIIPSQMCKETQVSLPSHEPLSKASSAVTSPETYTAKDVPVKKKLDIPGTEDKSKGMRNLPEQEVNVQKKEHSQKQHRQGSREIPSDKELPTIADQAMKGSAMRKPSDNVTKTTDGDSKDRGSTTKAQKHAQHPSKKSSSEDKSRADSHGGGSRGYLKVLPSDTYVFTATAAVIAGGDAKNPTAMLAAPEDRSPKAKGVKPHKADSTGGQPSHENVNEAGTKKRSSALKHPKTSKKDSPENTKKEQKPKGNSQAEKKSAEKPGEGEQDRDKGKEENPTDKLELERKRKNSENQEAAEQKVSDRKASVEKYEDKGGDVLDKLEAESKHRASKKDQESADQSVRDRKASVKKYEEMFSQHEAGSKDKAFKNDQDSADQKVSDRKNYSNKYENKQAQDLNPTGGTGEKAKDELGPKQDALKEGHEATDKKISEQAKTSGIQTMQLLPADDTKDGEKKAEDKLNISEDPVIADVSKKADKLFVDGANAREKSQTSIEEKTEATKPFEGVSENSGVPEKSPVPNGDTLSTHGATNDEPKPEGSQRILTRDATDAEIAVSPEESNHQPPYEAHKTREQRADIDDTMQGRVSVGSVGDFGNKETANMRAESIRDNELLAFTEKSSMPATTSGTNMENTQRYDVGETEGTQKYTEFIVPKALAFGSFGDDWTAQTPNFLERTEITKESKDLKSADSFAAEGTTTEVTQTEGTGGEFEMQDQQEDIEEDNMPLEESPPEIQPEEDSAERAIPEDEVEEDIPDIPEEAEADESAVFGEGGDIEPNEQGDPPLQNKKDSGVLQNVIELQNVDFELQSRPHAHLRGPDVRDFNFWDLDGPPVFYPESRLVFAVALVASTWILYLLLQTRMDTNRKTFFELHTVLTTGPEVPRARVITAPRPINEYSIGEADITEAGMIAPTEPRFLYSCDTPYCKQEASYLAQVLGEDPCVNFYGYVCNKQTRNWNPMIGSSISTDAFLVNDAAKLVAEYILNREHAGMKAARNLLEACLDHEHDEDWSRTELNELFFDYFGSSWPTENTLLTMEAVWAVAGRLARDLKLEALARVSVEVHPEDNSATVPSINEPVLLFRRDDFIEPEYPEMLESAAEQTATFMNPSANGRQVASEVKRTTELIADMISNDSAHSIGMQGYRLSTVRILEPGVRTFLRTVFLDSLRVADNAAILIKSPQFFENLEGAKGSQLNPQAVLNYMGFRVMVYFAAFLPQLSVQRLRALEANFMLPENASVQDFCTREIERVFPEIYARAFVLKIRNFSESVKFRSSDLKSKFLQGLKELTWIAVPNAQPAPVQDNDVSLARRKLESMTVGDAVPRWVLNTSSFEKYVQGLERRLEVALNLDPSNSLKRFCLFAKMLRHNELQEALLQGLSANQAALSVFRTEAWYDAQNNKIHVPLAVVDWSVPADSIAFVIHAARYAVRVFKALVRGLLPEYAYATDQRADGRSYSEEYRQRLRATVRCLLGQYEKASKAIKSEFLQLVTDHTSAGTALLEQSTALMQAYSVFKDLLLARRVWHSDFRLAGLPRLTSEQLFFVAYARDNCEASDRVHKRRQWLEHGMLPPEDRVNFPLRQFTAFARAFTCNHTAPMASNGHCPLVRVA